MSTPVPVPVVQTGFEKSLQEAAARVGKSLKINMGAGAKSIDSLSQPLGRITGQADQFTKSMEAANARVLAFGASVGIVNAVSNSFKSLITTTIEVEKSLASINTILGQSSGELEGFQREIFNVAKNTEQSFATVSQAALELSRQGLSSTQVIERLNDSMILSRLSGLGAAEAVAGLTAAINSFNKEGITSSDVLNKLSSAAKSAAVSERDLIEGIKRSGSVATQAGVSFDELVGVITAVQQRTARGGAVIGNSFKTIFTRIQSLEKLETMQKLGVQVTDASGQVLKATDLIQNLSKVLQELPDARKLQISEDIVGKFQLAPFLAILEDYNDESSKAIGITKVAQNATTEAYERNAALNKTLSSLINEATLNVQELYTTLGKIGITDNLKQLLGFFNNLIENFQGLFTDKDGKVLGEGLAASFVKGFGGILTTTILPLVLGIIGKLTVGIAKFGVDSLKTFFGLNAAAKEQAAVQGQIASTLLNSKELRKQMLMIEKSSLSAEEKKILQTNLFTTALQTQLGVMQKMAAISATIAPGVIANTKTRKGKAAGGYIPNYNAIMGYGSEQSDINRGVGGAPKSARPVTIPNFNFGGGQKGTMVANTSEYMVPNYAGTGGTAIFNQDMIASMGMPSGAKPVRAARGFIPNYTSRPLQDAIARESASGLPINQIRINQSGKLRNSKNPMGLAVTNTRDEPTGAIPNFQNYGLSQAAQNLSPKQIEAGFGGKEAANQLKQLGGAAAFTKDSLKQFLAQQNKVIKVQRDYFTGILVAQAAFGGLSAATADATEGVGKYANILSNSLGGVATAAFAGNMSADMFSKATSTLGKTVAGLGILGSVVYGGISIYKGAIEMINQYTGKNKEAALALAEVADAAKGLKSRFGENTEVEKEIARQEAKAAVGGTVGALRTTFSSGGYGAASSPQQIVKQVSRNFGGGEAGKKLESAFNEVALMLINLGMTTGQVDRYMDQFGEDLDRMDLSKMLDFAKSLDKKTFEGLTKLDSLLPDIKGGTGPLNIDVKKLSQETGLSTEQINKVIQKKSEAADEKREAEADLKFQNAEKEAARITATVAKQQLKFATEKLKLDRSSLDAQDMRILKAERLNSLSDLDLKNLKDERSQIEANLALRDATANAAFDIIDATKELTVQEGLSVELIEQLEALSKKSVVTEQDRADILKQANELIAESGDEVKASLKPILDKLELEKIGINNAKDRRDIEREITFEVEKQNQYRKDIDAAALGKLDVNQNAETLKINERIRGRELAKIQRSQMGTSILKSERLNVLNAQDDLLNAMDRAEEQRKSQRIAQEKQVIEELKKLSGSERQTIAANLGIQGGPDISGSEIIDSVGNYSKVLQEASNVSSKFGVELNNLINKFKDSDEDLEKQSQAVIANANANLEAAKKIALASRGDLISDMAVNLRRGATQGALDRDLAIDPVQRAKLAKAEQNRMEKVKALESGDLEGYKQILMAEEFSGKLIDASYEFAQNIGQALVDAIAKGESLGDVLLSAASNFFNTLSQAYLNRAVNSIVSGTGVLSMFNSGGRVTGGSGSKDDVPALLTGGEYVMRKSAVQKYGPDFMSALNSGQIPTFNRGGLFTPGTYGKGAISGKRDLLDFATQGFTTSNYDRVTGARGLASLALAPQSGALTMFGRRNSPQFQREQESKQKAFDLYVQQINEDKRQKEQRAMAKKGFLSSVLSFATSFALDSLFTKKRATGGSIPYASGIDTVPTMLSGGEFVMNAGATQRIGRSNLETMNAGGGGSNEVVQKLDELISVSENQGETVINITVNSDGTSQQDGNGDQQQESLALKIRDVVKQVISDEKRLGGSLRQVRA